MTSTPDPIAAIERFSNSHNANGLGFSNGVIADENGHYVLHSDYQDLARKVDAIKRDRSAAEADVLVERRRQVEAEGWSSEHDDTHDKGELAGAAACYALHGVGYVAPSHYPPRKVYTAVAAARESVSEKDSALTREAIRMALGEPKAPSKWPWDAAWWKPTDRRRDLVKAAALLIAEIERIDRARSLTKGENDAQG